MNEEQLMNRQLPQSLEAEQSVLGSILIDSRCVADIIGLLKPEDFFLPQNREIYETVYTMFNFSETIDPVTVLEKMRQLGVYHDNTRDYVQQLMEITPTAANAVRYAGIVKDKAMLRGLADASSDISEMVYDQVGTPAEILESAEKKIYALRKGDTGDSLEHIGVTLHKVFDTLTELSQSDSAIPGMSTGLRDLDKKINGLNKSDHWNTRIRDSWHTISIHIFIVHVWRILPCPSVMNHDVIHLLLPGCILYSHILL